jgi:hypothetical protein
MDALGDVWWFLFGTVLVVLVVDSALRTFVLPRAATPVITRGVFGGLRLLFDRMARFARTYSGRDRVMALYAPIGLVVLPLVWLCMEIAAFTAYFRALGVDDLERAFEMSGSSMFTLGFVRPPDVATVTLAFVEAASGLALLALLIAYLPTIYGAFSRREVQVAQLAVRAGEPPSGVNVLARAQSMERFTLLTDLWVVWQQWFAEVEETHTSLGVLSFFRSPFESRSWVTAAGAVLDAAALRQSVVDVPPDPEAAMCIRSGFFALRSIAAYFGIGFDPDPFPTDPISIATDEFEDACDRLVAAGVPVRADREQAWHDFRGWRVNYDRVLIALAALVMAPYAPWSSDRSLRYRRHAFRRGSSLGTDG